MGKYALILAGGKGTRFWPSSRENYPKQFLKIMGQKSFIQLTYERVAKLLPEENIYIVTAANQVDLIKEQLPKIAARNIVVEPAGRNTCPAIALGVTYIKKRDPNASIIVTPSDQLIKLEEEFVRQADRALDYAEENNSFVVFGIVPDSPHTGYGYIKSQIEGDGFAVVDQFVEKPSQEIAQTYLDKGDYFWNSGMFVFSIEVFMSELRINLPKMHDQMSEIYEAIDTANEKDVIERIYPETKRVSIDYGVMEHANNIHLLSFDVGWNDVGSWSSLYDVLPLDSKRSYYLNKDSVNVDSKGVIGFSDKPVAFVGIKDVVLVETPDAILVCSKDKAQDVRAVIDHYEEIGRKDLL